MPSRFVAALRHAGAGKHSVVVCVARQGIVVLAADNFDAGLCGEIVAVLGRLLVDDVAYLFIVTHVTEVAKFHANEVGFRFQIYLIH